ncbi:probable 2' cyclic ADP-D-ribose synthase BdTIR [Syzygium oleosum]|uniref:probable 2' cyclic ADP-D-ribose synthase BdTIR n=1 Tax=Syzygium oleosum TaxID=219896 RepID=UPI0024B9EC5E|nr:probable 2' cyclic ADP-D-ribose synthase BdTIR [Syzygium oleosum]
MSAVQRSLALSKSLFPGVIRFKNPVQAVCRPSYDVFINHRRIDTRRTVAGLLHDYLTRLDLRPFLDSRSMRPGDYLFDKIDSAILDCTIGVALFSPRYCESYFCLHELALMMDTKKKVIPIFCDVKPSQLRALDNGALYNGTCSEKEIERFNSAIEVAKNIVGITFDSSMGDWSELLRNASEAIIKSLMEANQDWPNEN